MFRYYNLSIQSQDPSPYGNSCLFFFFLLNLVRGYTWLLRSQHDRFGYSYLPNCSALVKMGDLLYDERAQGGRDLSDVAELYKKAALKNDPQVTLTHPAKVLVVFSSLHLPLCLLVHVPCRPGTVWGCSFRKVTDYQPRFSLNWSCCNITFQTEPPFLPASTTGMLRPLVLSSDQSV